MQHEHPYDLVVRDSVVNAKLHHTFFFILVALYDCEDSLARFENVDQFLEDLDHSSQAVSTNK